MIATEIIQQSISPDQQEGMIECLARILEIANDKNDICDSVIELFITKCKDTLLKPTLSKWCSMGSDQPIIASSLWKYINSHPDSLSLFSLCSFSHGFSFIGLPRIHESILPLITESILGIPVCTVENTSSEEENRSLSILSLFKSEWFNFGNETLERKSSLIQEEQGVSFIESCWKQYPAVFRHLLEVSFKQCKNDQFLRKCCDAICHFPWEVLHSYLNMIVAVFHIIITEHQFSNILPVFGSYQSEEENQIAFVLTRVFLYSIQVLLRDSSDYVLQCHQLDVLYTTLIQLNSWFCYQITTLVDNKEKKDGWSATMYSQLNNSLIYGLSFIICVDIHEKKPKPTKMIEVISEKKNDLVFLPSILDSLQPYLRYNSLVSEVDFHNKNRYHFVSILQCLVVCVQSIKEEFLEFFMDMCYPRVIVVLANEKDDLAVTLSLTVKNECNDVND